MVGGGLCCVFCFLSTKGRGWLLKGTSSVMVTAAVTRLSVTDLVKFAFPFPQGRHVLSLFFFSHFVDHQQLFFSFQEGLSTHLDWLNVDPITDIRSTYRSKLVGWPNDLCCDRTGTYLGFAYAWKQWKKKYKQRDGAVSRHKKTPSGHTNQPHTDTKNLFFFFLMKAIPFPKYLILPERLSC